MHYTLGIEGLKSGFRPFIGITPVGRFWMHYLNPMTYFRWFKRFVQRGYRGYADNDHWDANSYLEHVLAGVIRDLRDHAHGYPQILADYPMDYSWKEGDAPDTGFERWTAVLNEILDGLQAARELSTEETVPEGVYPTGPWSFKPVENHPELVEYVDQSPNKFDEVAYAAWRAPLLVKRKRAMLLLCKHWESLWD